MNRRFERNIEPYGIGVPMPVLLSVWLVCTVCAALIWYSIAGNVPGAQPVSFPTWLVLGLGFGFAGAGLFCLIVDIVRRP